MTWDDTLANLRISEPTFQPGDLIEIVSLDGSCERFIVREPRYRGAVLGRLWGRFFDKRGGG
jgi:hypothetical protein